MELFRRDSTHLVLHLSQLEKELLYDVAKLYPVEASPCPSLSRSIATEELKEEQAMLEEALSEHKQENQQHLRRLLFESNRMKQHDDAYYLWLRREEPDFLLQVLNEIRVATWIRLGRPEDIHTLAYVGAPDPETNAYIWAVEVTSYFQAKLLQILQEG